MVRRLIHDKRQEVAEPIDEAIGIELGGWLMMVAIADCDTAHTCRASSFYVVHVIANHQYLAGLEVELSGRFQKRCRVRLALLKSIAADNYREKLG
ncbi:hypothetical protein HY68_37320 [Streptomyces sp. AcH 505]|nr:hypothetical protein HY68_37320 [Streptomyces sp. AcH 505]